MYHIKIIKQTIGSAKTYEHNLLDERPVVDRQRYHMAAKFGVFVDVNNVKHLTLYWSTKLHKRPYGLCFIAYSSSCITTEQTHVEFARTKEQLFDRWCSSKKVCSDNAKLRQLMRVEEFKWCIISDVRTVLNEK